MCLPSICSLSQWVKFIPEDTPIVRRTIGGGRALGVTVAMWVFLAKRKKIEDEVESWVKRNADDGRNALRYGMWLQKVRHELLIIEKADLR